MTMDWLWTLKEFLANFVDPEKLSLFVAAHEHTIYLILFAIVFCETGLVVTPILARRFDAVHRRGRCRHGIAQSALAVRRLERRGDPRRYGQLLDRRVDWSAGL